MNGAMTNERFLASQDHSSRPDVDHVASCVHKYSEMRRSRPFSAAARVNTGSWTPSPRSPCLRGWTVSSESDGGGA